MREIAKDSLGRTLYVKANGNGPLHLLAAESDQRETLCGVRRIDAAGRGTPMYDPAFHGVCATCASRHRGQLQVNSPEVEASLSDLSAALNDLAAARGLVAQHLLRVRGVRDPRLDGHLKIAQENGYTFKELGDLIGLTRERVRQRVAATKDQA